MKVIAIIGSARKMHTYNASVLLLEKLKALGDIEYELIRLSDYELKTCCGCKLCTDKGEESCPLNDDRDMIINKIDKSDGLVFATPNYSFHMSGLMKIFIDRLGYIFHRPCFFDKTCTSIVAQGIFGGNKIMKYFDFIGKAMGCNPVKGSCITTLEPMTEKVQRKNDIKIERLSKRFYKKLMKKEKPQPSIFDLLIFRVSRTKMKLMLSEDYRDFLFYNERGWFESDYYYPVKLSLFKKTAGRFFDSLIAKTI